MNWVQERYVWRKRIKWHLSPDWLGSITTSPFQQEDKKEAASQTASHFVRTICPVHRCLMLEVQLHRTALINRSCKTAAVYLCKQIVLTLLFQYINTDESRCKKYKRIKSSKEFNFPLLNMHNYGSLCEQNQPAGRNQKRDFLFMNAVWMYSPF